MVGKLYIIYLKAIETEIKSSIYSKRRIKYNVIPKQIKNEITKKVLNNEMTLEEAFKRVKCSKRNIKNWVKHKELGIGDNKIRQFVYLLALKIKKNIFKIIFS